MPADWVLLGIFVPVMWLKQMIKANQKELDYGLADALDLMVVCVEAGLTIDSAMLRVGEELAEVHPSISRELGIAHMETRIGLTRVESLRNLGTRTGNERCNRWARCSRRPSGSARASDRRCECTLKHYV